MKVSDPEALVLDIIPPPQLHLMMGAVNHLYNIVRRHMIKVKRGEIKCFLYISHSQVGKLRSFDDWCQKQGISRRGELKLYF